MEALDRVIHLAARRPGATFRSLLTAARGAFPTVVAERLRVLGYDHLLPLARGRRRAVASTSGGPEPHPLDFSWYFTRKSAEGIAQRLLQHGGGVLCLGAPTVASVLARRGRETRLLDRDTLILRRFDLRGRRLSVDFADLRAPMEIGGKPSVVFFDSPWYPEYVLLWLWLSIRAVRPGGIVAFVLFEELLRPGAERERARLIRQAEKYGRVTTLERLAVYDTPPFEREALVTTGINPGYQWRHGDLVLIEGARDDDGRAPRAIEEEGDWETFVIGRQVVKLRRNIRTPSDAVIGLVPGCSGFALPSVSRRDRRRRYVDLWTSRNRVATVGRADVVAAVLGEMAARGATAAGSTPRYLDEREATAWREAVSGIQALLG